LAYVIYTSGSTGKAKGMGIEHRNTVNFLEWARAVFREEELKRVLFSTSLNFDLAVYESLTPLTVGSTVRIVENALELAEGGGEGVTLMNTVPSAMKVLVEGNHIPSSVRVVNLAGEVLKRDLVEDIFAETAAEKVCNLYGPTETTTYSTWREMKREEGFAGDIGRGVGNTRVYILNQEMDAVPVGVIGEICIAGAGVGRGYENRGDLTAERFVPDPYCMDKQGCEAGQRMYRTGDLGRWSCEGQIELIGRNDYQVKVRGYRIELGEIEARLEECEGVKEAVVAARESGTGDKRLVAYYTEMEGAAGDKAGAEEMRRHLASRLPEYMVPGVYVRLEHLPLTANGKLDRKALPTPEDDGQILSGYQAPEGEIETEMAAIWAEVLKLERVGRHDNFFSLGGHSLLAARLIGRMRKSGLNVDVRNLFKTPTVAELTAAASYRIPLNRIAEATEPQESSSKEIQLRI
jgi:acyl-coenzyme A synthetase/AMP-(fatty) acid ligase/aryl carrier-like protein